jgi:hypothetical protein
MVTVWLLGGGAVLKLDLATFTFQIPNCRSSAQAAELINTNETAIASFLAMTPSSFSNPS